MSQVKILQTVRMLTWQRNTVFTIITVLIKLATRLIYFHYISYMWTMVQKDTSLQWFSLCCFGDVVQHKRCDIFTNNIIFPKNTSSLYCVYLNFIHLFIHSFIHSKLGWMSMKLFKFYKLITNIRCPFVGHILVQVPWQHWLVLLFKLELKSGIFLDLSLLQSVKKNFSSV